MRILLTADIHYNSNWFAWLSEQALNFDLIAIAGDLLNIFVDIDLAAQIVLAQAHCRRIAENTHLVISSGNHDATGDVVLPPSAPAYQWLVELSSVKNVTPDGQTEIVRDLVVSTIPYGSIPITSSPLFESGHRLRAETGKKWLVIHHEPPALNNIETGESNGLRKLLEEYKPNYCVSGHIHNQPYELGGRWAHLIGETILFTPGQIPYAPWPNHIELNLATGKAYWRTTRPRYDPVADGLAEEIWRWQQRGSSYERE